MQRISLQASILIHLARALQKKVVLQLQPFEIRIIYVTIWSDQVAAQIIQRLDKNETGFCLSRFGPNNRLVRLTGGPSNRNLLCMF